MGKTSIACATAVGLADNGKKILLISTDPLQTCKMSLIKTLNGHGTDIQEVPGLTVVNLDPEQAAAEYREALLRLSEENCPIVLSKIWKNNFQVLAR